MTVAGMDIEQFKRNRRGRNLALAAVLAGLIVLFYVMTIVRLGGAS